MDTPTVISSPQLDMKHDNAGNKGKLLFLAAFAIVGSFAAGIMTGSQKGTYTYNNRATAPQLTPILTPRHSPTPLPLVLTVGFTGITPIPNPTRASNAPTLNPTQAAAPTPIRYKVMYKQIRKDVPVTQEFADTDSTPTPSMLGKPCTKTAECKSAELVCDQTKKECVDRTSGVPSFFYANSNTPVYILSNENGVVDSTRPDGEGEDPPPPLVTYVRFSTYASNPSSFKDKVFELQCKTQNPTCRPVTKISLVEDGNGKDPGGAGGTSPGGTVGNQETGMQTSQEFVTQTEN